jgi:hypothetical protein
VSVLAIQPVRSEDGGIRVSTSVSSSEDGGRSFSEPLLHFHSDLNLNVGNPVPLSDGSILFPFLDFQSSRGRLEAPRLWAVRTEDGGRTLSVPHLVGENVHPEIPSLAVQHCGSRSRDRLFLAWTRNDEQRAGVFLSRSLDGGVTWTEPVGVTEAQAPAQGYLRPVVAVDSTGRVGLIWYGIHHEGGSECATLYFSISVDGGQSFEEAARVSERPSCYPRRSRWRAGGDYQGLVAAADARFHALWADGSAGRFRIWSATLDPDVGAGPRNGCSAAPTAAIETRGPDSRD